MNDQADVLFVYSHTKCVCRTNHRDFSGNKIILDISFIRFISSGMECLCSNSFFIQKTTDFFCFFPAGTIYNGRIVTVRDTFFKTIKNHIIFFVFCNRPYLKTEIFPLNPTDKRNQIKLKFLIKVAANFFNHILFCGCRKCTDKGRTHPPVLF